MLHELAGIIWMPSFVKNYQSTVSRYSISFSITLFTFNVIVLEQSFWSCFYHFSATSLSNSYHYATIVLLYSPYFRFILTRQLSFEKICSWLVNGQFNELVLHAFLKLKFQSNSMVTLFDLLVIVLNLYIIYDSNQIKYKIALRQSTWKENIMSLILSLASLQSF